MKSPILIRFLLIVVLPLSFQECADTCKVTNTYTYYKPVYSTSAEVKSAVAFVPPRTLTNLGKIYFKDGYLFINQVGEGIHVIDNRNPSSPVPVGFLKIPGNYDLAMVDNVLYADSFVDLVAFDATNKRAIKEIYRVERLFDRMQSFGLSVMSSNNLVLTNWEQVKTVDVYESECDSRIQPWGGRFFEDGIALANSSAAMKSGGPSTTGGGGTAGIGGSMARFTISHDHLYALNGSKMEVVSVETPAKPEPRKEVEVGWDVETLFPYKENLFAGSRTGMYIYSLEAPETPEFLSKYQHVVSCDPVVVDDEYAYVTLRTENSCARGVNQLQVIDIKNLSSPSLVKTYAMTNPRGLGIDNKILFICDGNDGLKVYDATDVTAIDSHRLAYYPGIKTLDIIPFQNVAMMIGTDGLYQYDYSDLNNIQQLSKIVILQ